MDIDNAHENVLKFKAKFKNLDIIETSGLLNQNLIKPLDKIGNVLIKINDDKALWELYIQENNDNPNYKVYEYQEKELDVNVINLGNEIWKVEGKDVFIAYHKTPISTYDNLLLFNKKLQDLKVFDILRAKGAQPGDMVKIFEYELECDG